MGHAETLGLEELDDESSRFYGEVLATLNDAGVPYLVAGSFAAATYTGREPHTKDLDLFITPDAVDDATAALERVGIATERPYPHWIAKAKRRDDVVDLIYRASSGIWEVASEWREGAPVTKLFGAEVRICPVEALIWTKATIMDRGRYDGNDVQHLLQARAHDLDWERLRQIAGPHWRLLLAHLAIFGYVYPDLASLVPRNLLAEMALRLVQEVPEADTTDGPLCRGTLISNAQYLLDVEELGYHDARLQPWGPLRQEEIEAWMRAVKEGTT